MIEREDLNLVTEIYTNDPFERENAIHNCNYVSKCLKYSTDRSFWLELGLGHGVVLQRMSRHFKSMLVLDGSSELVERYTGLYPNVQVELKYFEDFTSDSKFRNIGMGFILEHVDDPAAILNRYRKMLADGGHIFVGVPTASSLHRLLARHGGLLADIRMMSETDRRLGHKRFLTYEDWMEMFRREDFRVERAEGLYLKPLTTTQLETANLDHRVYEALGEIATGLPQISNACFFLLGNE